MQKKFIHIDMDCFYAAVEMRDNPQYRNIPIAVGGQSKRGVLCTANYIARQYGVRSAMPNGQALQLCPNLKIVSGRMSAYKAVSDQIRQIFARYTDKIEPLSLDEAFLDVTDSPLFYGSATLIANDIRRAIESETGLTASAGIAPVKFLAKIASDENKPNGYFLIKPDEVEDFALKLDLKKIPGVGKVTLQKLHDLGLYTGADVVASPLQKLHENLGQFADVIRRRSQGIDERELCLERVRKSVGVETTFEHDLTSLAQCVDKIAALYEKLKERLDRTQLAHQVNKLGVKIKFADFTATTVDQHGCELDMAVFYALLEKGFNRGQGRRVRLLGLNLGIGEQTQNNQLALPFE
jgi:DNA polymerase-4